MGLYETYILPGLMHWVCSHKDLSKQRKKVVPRAKGRVLEVGIGSGLNLPFNVDFIALTGEEIPLENHSADTVLVTYTLCSIPDVKKALKEMNRVLKPGGELIFCEHGKAPDDHIRRWQDRVNPVWTKISGGCHLNRPIPDLIKESGFDIRYLESAYSSPLKIVSFNYWGMAVCG